MKPCLHLKAKSSEWGDVSLVEHLEQVVAACEKIAKSSGLDKKGIQIARIGAILHDIGKASPVFQERLSKRPAFIEDIFRHEIASLFFLPLFPKGIRPQLIDMIVAHHRSIKNDGREQGLLDLEERFELKNRGGKIFEMHAKGWQAWQKEALRILQYFDIQVREITPEEAFESLYDAIEYCHSKKMVGRCGRVFLWRVTILLLLLMRNCMISYL